MELYFNMYKIKYVKLDELLKDIIFEEGEEINIFINLESVLKKIKFTDEDKENIFYGPKRNLNLISCIFNLISHYRHYFNKRGICSKVFIYGPEGKDERYLNREYNKNYRKDILLMETSNTISIGNIYRNIISMLKDILLYVKDVYFITSGIVEPSVIPYIITKISKSNKNFLITSDIYEYQYTKENFYILKPKMDDSILIDKNNVMQVLKKKVKCKSTLEPDINFISFILSILGNSYRGITKIKKVGISTIFKLIDTGIKNNIINNDVENINILLNVVEEYNQNQIMINYLCTSVKEQYKRLSISEVSYIEKQLINKHDAGYLRDVNDKYFMNYPLNIIEISEGIKKKQEKIIWR